MINWVILSFTVASWSPNKSELCFAHSLTRLTPHSDSSFGVLWILIAVFSSVNGSCNSCSSYVKHKQFCSLFPYKFWGKFRSLTVIAQTSCHHDGQTFWFRTKASQLHLMCELGNDLNSSLTKLRMQMLTSSTLQLLRHLKWSHLN